MKRSRWVAIVLAAVLLAGCGSGGGGSDLITGGTTTADEGTGGEDTGGGNSGGDTTGGTTVDTLGGPLGTLTDIGDYWNALGFGNSYYYTRPIDLNASNEILGYTLGAHSPFVRHPSTGIMTFVPGRGGRTYDDYYSLKTTPSTNFFQTATVLQINDSGLVIGNSSSFQSANNTRAFIYNYRTDTLVDLPPINYLDNEGKRKFREYSNVADINEAGWVLLTSENSEGKKKCYLWDGSSTQVVNDLKREDDSDVPAFAVPSYIFGGSILDTESIAVAINENLVNGSYQYVCNSNGTAFVFDGYDGTPINQMGSSELVAVDMNNALPVGHVAGNAGTEGFFWDGGEVYPISNPKGDAVTVVDLNNNDKVIGNSGGRGFIWNLDATGKGVFREIGTLGGVTSVAVAINDNNVVIGYSETGQSYKEGNITRSIVHAFAWRDGIMYDLGTHVPSFVYPFTPNFPFSEATAINEANTIIGGSYTINSHFRGFLLFPTFP